MVLPSSPSTAPVFARCTGEHALNPAGIRGHDNAAAERTKKRCVALGVSVHAGQHPRTIHLNEARSAGIATAERGLLIVSQRPAQLADRGWTVKIESENFLRAGCRRCRRGVILRGESFGHILSDALDRKAGADVVAADAIARTPVTHQCECGPTLQW